MNANLGRAFYSIRYRRFGKVTTIWKSTTDSFVEARRAYETLLPDANRGVLEIWFHPICGYQQLIDASVR
jgi:hypothetical protein